jgi:hypothetical protein
MTYVETDCTVTHEGRTFEAGGAVVTPDRIIAYPAADGILTDWHGRQLGTWRSVSSWRLAQWSPIGGWIMHQIEAVVDGVTYTGRGFGQGCLYRGRRKAGQ